jgi:hypothetical protein
MSYLPKNLAFAKTGNLSCRYNFWCFVLSSWWSFLKSLYLFQTTTFVTASGDPLGNTYNTNILSVLGAGLLDEYVAFSELHASRYQKIPQQNKGHSFSDISEAISVAPSSVTEASYSLCSVSLRFV